MADTPYVESEALLYAVRGDEDGLAVYLTDADRITLPGLRALRDAAYELAEACETEIDNRG